MVQTDPSSSGRSADNFLSKICSFLPFFLLHPCFSLYGHSTASQPYICIRVTVLSSEFGMSSIISVRGSGATLFIIQLQL
jgi:hypothetical protein